MGRGEGLEPGTGLADYRKPGTKIGGVDLVSTPGHTPVMVEEAIQALAVSPGGRYIDATVNGCGHAAVII